ncbi:MAG: bifunctional enoyl-CoA hydratase/phosphate acetyltransferase [candidate division WOR-3 bacterium]
MSKFKIFEEKLKERKIKARVAVVNATIESAIDAAVEAANKGFAYPILIGQKAKIEELLKKVNYNGECEIVDSPNEVESAKIAVNLVKEGKADVILKGSITTSNFMRPILSKETGIVKPGSLVSHVSVFSLETYHKFLIVTDVAINIAPTLEEKVKIIKNAIELARNLDIKQPKVAILAAAETVNLKMQSSVDAAIISKMGDRGDFGDALVEGPMALDLAVSKEACEEKNFHSPVGADADIVVAPEIDAGNVLYKSLTKLAKADLAAILVGTLAPVVLTSRGDTAEIKYWSLVLALMMLKK